MPYASRLFVRTGVVYLVVTFVAGAVMLILEAVGRPVAPVIWIEHGHAGFVGWLVNTVIGVALWLLPLNRQRFPESQGRYPERLALAAFYLLNLGLAVRLVCEPWFAFAPSGAASALLVAAAVFQAGAIVMIAWILWQRIFRPPLRPTL